MNKYLIHEIHNVMPLSGNWRYKKNKADVLGLMLVTLKQADQDGLFESTLQKILIPFSYWNIGPNSYKNLIDLDDIIDIENF